MKDYYVENRKKVLEQQKIYKKEIIPCPHCGCTYTRGNEYHHKK